MRPAHLLSIVAIVSCLLAGCSGGSSTGSGGSNDADLRPYLAMDLTSGQITYRQSPGASDTPDQVILFKQLGTGGTYLATTEVTRGQWQSIMGTTPWSSLPGAFQSAAGALAPADNLTFAEAQAAATAVAHLSGRRVRLATAAELASAQDAGVALSTRITGWNVREANRSGTVAVTAAGAENGWYGLIGNVREWSSDGQLSGGGWMDNAAICPASIDTIGSERHPLSGVRLAIAYP